MSDFGILDEFWNSGSNSGGLVRDCKHGITWFDADPGAGDWDEGELEDLLKKAEENPEKYRVGLNGVHDTNQLGMHWVWGCVKCMEEAKKYQDFIWAHRYAISSFLNARLKNLAKETAREKERLTIAESDTPKPN